jgi:hypothetical protein
MPLVSEEEAARIWAMVEEAGLATDSASKGTRGGEAFAGGLLDDLRERLGKRMAEANEKEVFGQDTIENLHRRMEELQSESARLTAESKAILAKQQSDRGPANERQIGGDHYRVKEGEQHWDRIFRLFGPGYMIGQTTKYVERYQKKGGLSDLRKAQHFLDKLIELEEALTRGEIQVEWERGPLPGSSPPSPAEDTVTPAILHFPRDEGSGTACGQPRGAVFVTRDPEDVNCPECRKFMAPRANDYIPF